jgi:hypothetical protein
MIAFVVIEPLGVRCTFTVTLRPGGKRDAVLMTEHLGGSTDGTMNRLQFSRQAADRVLDAIQDGLRDGPKSAGNVCT